MRPGTRDLVYLSATYVINPTKFLPNHQPEILVLPKIQGQTEVGKILQKNQKYGRMQEVNQLKGGK